MALDIDLHRLQQAHGRDLTAFGLEEQANALADALEAGKTVYVYQGRLVTKQTPTRASSKDFLAVADKVNELRKTEGFKASDRLNTSLQRIKARVATHDIPTQEGERKQARLHSWVDAAIRSIEKIFQ